MSRRMPAQKPGTSEQSVGTPPEFVTAACRMLGIDAFTVDLAASHENAVCSQYLGIADDSLNRRWADLPSGWLWLNPPFGDIAPWVQKAYEESQKGASIAVLIPGSIGANWWADWVQDKAAIFPLQGRITFVGQSDGFPKDCALLLYGGPYEVGYYPAWKWMNSLTDEEKQMAKERIAKERARSGGDNVRPIAEGRKKKRTPPPEDPTNPDINIDTEGTVPLNPGRVTVFKPNGGSSMAIAPAPSPLDLGPIIVPEPEDAQRVLRELAELNDQALQAGKVYADLKERTKTAKEKYDAAAERVLTRLQVCTHAGDLPLFDAAQQEQDVAAMVGASDPIEDSSGEAQGVDQGVEGADVAPSVVGTLGEAPIEADTVPF